MKDKWIKLLRYLITQTNEDLLNWKETADPDEFLVRVGENTVAFSVNDLNFDVSILNNTGKVVDSFDRSTLLGMHGEDWFPEARELHSQIKRKVSGADKVLDDVLRWFERNEPIQF